jgi:2-oxoglutarate dehydrogenase E1 component
MNEQSSNEFFHGSSFMQGQNAEYLENLRLNFKENHNSVDSAWQAFFQSLESNASEPSESSVKPSWTRQDWPQQPNDELKRVKKSKKKEIKKIQRDQETKEH